MSKGHSGTYYTGLLSCKELEELKVQTDYHPGMSRGHEFKCFNCGSPNMNWVSSQWLKPGWYTLKRLKYRHEYKCVGCGLHTSFATTLDRKPFEKRMKPISAVF